MTAEEFVLYQEKGLALADAILDLDIEKSPELGVQMLAAARTGEPINDFFLEWAVAHRFGQRLGEFATVNREPSNTEYHITDGHRFKSVIATLKSCNDYSDIRGQFLSYVHLLCEHDRSSIKAKNIFEAFGVLPEKPEDYPVRSFDSVSEFKRMFMDIFPEGSQSKQHAVSILSGGATPTSTSFADSSFYGWSAGSLFGTFSDTRIPEIIRLMNESPSTEFSKQFFLLNEENIKNAYIGSLPHQYDDDWQDRKGVFSFIAKHPNFDLPYVIEELLLNNDVYRRNFGLEIVFDHLSPKERMDTFNRVKSITEQHPEIGQTDSYLKIKSKVERDVLNEKMGQGGGQNPRKRETL